MKGRPPTKEEKDFMSQMGQIGCIACRKMGCLTPNVSIHHIEGRAKDGCHFKVLPLCEKHHQIMDTHNPPRWFSIHGNKKQFEEEYGSENELYLECLEIIEDVYR